MSLTRRYTFLCLSSMAIMGTTLQPVSANPDADRPMTIIVQQPAGSGGDMVARMLSQLLSKESGRPVVVDNRPGANGIIATSYVAKAKPDGHTLLLSGFSPISFNPHLYKELPYDPSKDLTYIAPIVDSPFVLLASAKSQVKSFDDLRTAGKKSTELNFSSGGVGNSTHLVMEMILEQAGIKARHIPYNGVSPALQGLMSGETDLMVSVLASARSAIATGRIVPLAVFRQERVADFPDLPTFSEVGLKSPTSPGWYILAGPAGMSPILVKELNTQIHTAMSTPEAQQQAQKMTMDILEGSSEFVSERIASESKSWGQFIRERNITIQ